MILDFNGLGYGSMEKIMQLNKYALFWDLRIDYNRQLNTSINPADFTSSSVPIQTVFKRQLVSTEIFFLLLEVNVWSTNQDLCFLMLEMRNSCGKCLPDSFPILFVSGGFGRSKKVSHRNDFQSWSRSIIIRGTLNPFQVIKKTITISTLWSPRAIRTYGRITVSTITKRSYFLTLKWLNFPTIK